MRDEKKEYNQMNNLERWANNLPIPSIDSFDELKNVVEEKVKNDYVFFPFLIGYIKRFLGNNASIQAIRDHLFQLLFELLAEKKIEIIYVTSKSMEVAEWNSLEDINLIIEKVKNDWDKLGGREPEVNEVIWIQAYEGRNQNK